jgi:hypothetical protein
MRKNKRLIRGLFAPAVVLSLMLVFFIAACEDRGKKMEAIERTYQVEYFKQKYRVGKVDLKSELVYIIEPDGVQIPVPLDDVKPVE